MSHHLDTPLASQTGQLYLDDLYVFPGEGSTVLVMDVNSNVNGLFSEPGFHPEARYEFKVHFDGGDFEALTYRVSFGEADSSGRQALQLHALTGDQAREDSADGELVLEGRTGEAASRDGTRIWAGRIGDSFYIDLSLLAIVNAAVARRDRTGPVGVAAGERAEQLRQHPRRLHRPGGLSPAPAAAARRPHRRVVRHQAGHRRGRLAADQPLWAPHDVADLLAQRHRLLRPRQHPAPVGRLRRHRPVHRRPDRRRGLGQRHLR